MTSALGVGGKSKSGPKQGPEKGPKDTWGKWQLQAEELLGEGLKDIVVCIMENVKLKHLPSLTLLMQIADRTTRREPIPERDYVSLAEVLWKEFNELRDKGLGLEGEMVEILDAGSGGGELDSE